MNGILVLGIIFGLVFGSLVKALADRSVTKRSFMGRSYCEKCKHMLSWYDLFPVFSYLSTRGRCRYCKTKLSVEYPLVEVLMGLLIGTLFFLNSANLAPFFSGTVLLKDFYFLATLVFLIFVLCVLVIVFLTDVKTGLIPDRVTYPAITIAFGYLLVGTIFRIYLLYDSLKVSVIGKYLLPPSSDYFYRHAFYSTYPFLEGVAAAILMALFFGIIIVVTKGRGMGGGDFKLAIFLGLVLGFSGSLLCLMVAFIAGSIVGLLLIIFGKKHFGQTIPFGPFLTLGGIVAVFWGERIINWYLSLRIG